MVILIGGSSHVGKTLVSHRLIKKYAYECLSLDSLKEAFAATQIGNPGTRNDYQMRYWMWPFVAEVIKYALHNGRNLIVEGCYIPAEWAQSFSESELGEIRCVFIIMSEGSLRDHEDEVRSHASDIEKRRNDYIDIQRLVDCSREFKEDCLRTGTYYIEIAGEYDEDSLADAVEAVIEDDDPKDGAIVL